MELARKDEKVKVIGRLKFIGIQLLARWPSLLALAMAATGLPASTDPMSFILILIALVYPIAGAIRGHLRGFRTILIQAIAFVVFCIIAIVSLYVDRDTGLTLLAAGYIGHAIWDFAHYRSNKIVWRWYSEWCTVLDFFIAAFLIAPIFK